jgi:hypothetical protein
MKSDCFRSDLRKRLNSSRWFHAVLLLAGTIFLPVVTGILINMYTGGRYPGSGYVLLLCVAMQLALSAILIVREHQIREPAIILMEAEDVCRDLVAARRELVRRDEAYRMVRSAFDALNKQVCEMFVSFSDFSVGLRPIFEKFTANMWTALGCTSNRYTIEAYFDPWYFGGGRPPQLPGTTMVFFSSPTVQFSHAVQLQTRHPAVLNWNAGVGRDVNEIRNLPTVFLREGKPDPAVYFNRYAVVTIPTQCQDGRLGLLVLTAEQEEPFATNVLDTLDFLATIISAYHRKYSDCRESQQLQMELRRNNTPTRNVSGGGGA